MESLVFALFVNVVVVVWMSQGSYAGVSERWVCNRRVLICGEQVPAGRFESAQDIRACDSTRQHVQNVLVCAPSR